MAIVTVVQFDGMEIDTRCAELLRIVMKYATSGDCDARETRRKALKKLGEYGCTTALSYIVDKLATSGDCDARETRRMALDML
jgi:hypothetical protein